LSFGHKLKSEREKKGWSQDELAEKIYVSRQSVSKWENNKNYPSIETIINLSDLFDITIDELLRSDDRLKEKVIEDGTKNKYMTFKAQLLCFLGIFFGMIITSFIKNGTVEWLSIFELIIYTMASLYLLNLLFANKKVNSKLKES